MNIEDLYKITNIKVLVYGDYIVDKYISGKVNRISPEAPVPVIEVNQKSEKLGGAGNTINNIIALGASVRAIGYVGEDENGDFLFNYFHENKIETTFMKKYKSVKTISKTRIVSKNQQFLRLDEEVIEEPPTDYYEYLLKNIDDVFKNINSLVISDYGKGAVSKKLAQMLINEANKREIPIIVDPKGSDYSKYEDATVCTPNVKELCTVTGRELTEEMEIQEASNLLLNNIHLKYLMLTRSEKGISLFQQNDKIGYNFPAISKEVIDVTGAGDTVVATVSVLLPLEIDIKEICKICNTTASIVVSKFGTSTATLNELISHLNVTDNLKLLTKETIEFVINDLREKNKKIVFTNGCFDLLHAGHLSSFKTAKQLGDILIVAVNSDNSVKENKGDLRPIINEEDRIKMVSELECVDYVILMDDKEPSNLIRLIKPDIQIKGKDWENKYMPEKELIESIGGKIEFIELAKDKSTTKIIEKIIKVYGKDE